jgi:VanZ family protein
MPNFLAVIILSFGTMTLPKYQNSKGIFQKTITFTGSMITYEFLQLIIPGRVFDFKDIIASLLGGTFAYLILYLAHQNSTSSKINTNSTLMTKLNRHLPFIILFLGVLLFTYFWEVGIRPHLLKNSISSFYLLESFPNFLSIVILSFGAMALFAPKEDIAILKLTLSLTCGVILYEIYQMMMPERVFDYKDIIASILGFVFSYLILYLINRILLS